MLRRARLSGPAGPLLGVAVGVLVAVVVTLLQDSTYRADASIVLVRQGQPPGSDPELADAAEAAAELFHSRAVAESAALNLRLDESPDELLDRVSLETAPASSLIRVEVDGPTPDAARRAAQEVAEVSTVLYNERFGPETVASIWETPRADEARVSPRPARNLVLGALLGALLAQLALVVSARPRRERPVAAPATASVTVSQAPPPAPVPESRAVEPVAAAPAAESASGTVTQAPPPAPPATPEPAAQPEPEPTPEPEPEPEPARPFVEPRLGEWTVRDVEALLAEQGPAFPDRLDELGFYLASFREVAGPDDPLPGGVEGIVEDVFRDLIERARTTSAA